MVIWLEQREASFPFYNWPLHGTPLQWSRGLPDQSLTLLFHHDDQWYIAVSSYTHLFSLTQLSMTGHHTCISEFYSLYFDVLWLLSRRWSLDPPNYRKRENSKNQETGSATTRTLYLRHWWFHAGWECRAHITWCDDHPGKPQNPAHHSWREGVSSSVAMSSAKDSQPSSSRWKITAAISDDQNALGGIEEQVRVRKAKHLKRASTVSFCTTYDDSGIENSTQVQVRRKSKGAHGRLHMADTTVVWHVTWPQVTYIPSGQPAIYDCWTSSAL